MNLLKVKPDLDDSVREYHRKKAICAIAEKVEFIDGKPNLEAVNAWESEVFALYGKTQTLYDSAVGIVHLSLNLRMRAEGTWTLWRAREAHGIYSCYPPVSVEEYKRLLDEPKGALCLLPDGVTLDGKIDPPRVVFCQTVEEADELLKDHSVGGSKMTCMYESIQMESFHYNA